ncbi:helix-turn-helix domain-containing protein [Variovorax sp. J22G73]|jgi:DNA-binding MarR family transcriptional regulator|uniref:MarR family transcriptional regulator n=1 Tax=unclassified Variovorax TaxID=663243 RepID=UPI000D5D2AAF|nr:MULTISPECIES: helix-turn-helix domain-containing protein [unclassified Variovorax]MDM0006727.1 helix-turn-helix domain-containing protein [Variovorax sp. J22R203]MDM0097249.1 helix-turn-helix domain-containing protein [Variovorax sp. J22G73]
MSSMNTATTANTATALDFCLALGRAHASLGLRLGDDLGAFHGLDFGDFILLSVLLRAEGAGMPLVALARTLGLPMSALMRRMVLLEKTGLAERVPGPAADPRRHAALRPGGRQLAQTALLTVEAHCKAFVQPVAHGRLQSAHEVLATLIGDNELHA